jgi:hypothetical protein
MLSEIPTYWTWQLERLKWLGLTCQILGMFAFAALWWHQDRGWRALRILFIIYFAVLALIRFFVWTIYGLLFNDLGEKLLAFMVRSGIAGAALCILMIAFLVLDRTRGWVRFDDFGQDAFKVSLPSGKQWIGLGIAILAIWWPFAPNPLGNIHSLYTWSFPTSFGVTLTPVLLFLCGLTLAGSRKSRSVAVLWIGLETVASAMLVDPISIHGLVAVALSLAAVFLSYR